MLGIDETKLGCQITAWYFSLSWPLRVWISSSIFLTNPRPSPVQVILSSCPSEQQHLQLLSFPLLHLGTRAHALHRYTHLGIVPFSFCPSVQRPKGASGALCLWVCACLFHLSCDFSLSFPWQTLTYSLEFPAVVTFSWKTSFQPQAGLGGSMSLHSCLYLPLWERIPHWSAIACCFRRVLHRAVSL